MGFNNQEFLFHGTSNDIYNIISERNFQFNAKFLHYNSKYLADYSTWFSEFGLKIGKNNKICIFILIIILIVYLLIYNKILIHHVYFN